MLEHQDRKATSASVTQDLTSTNAIKIEPLVDVRVFALNSAHSRGKRDHFARHFAPTNGPIVNPNKLLARTPSKTIQG